MRIPIVVTWKKIAAAGALGVVGALAVGWSGLVSVAANTGHLAPVEWFLHWTLKNAVDTQSLTIAVPADIDLSDPVLIQKAAGHFATGCATCHGAPGVNQTAEYKSMTPTPPRLETQGGEWKDRELFWIGQHGIKYSGMPSWATQERPDEVWAMVAFLRALPDMTPETYRELALGGADGRPAPVGQASVDLTAMDEIALADCARCHGEDGRGRVTEFGNGSTRGAFPSIAGQPEAYLLETLRAYASGRRESGYMQPAATRYPDEVLARLASHFAGQPPGGPVGGDTPGTSPGLPETPTKSTASGPVPQNRLIDAEASAASRQAIDAIVDPAAGHGAPRTRDGLLELGEMVATRGLAPQKVPACESCHGGTGRARNPLYPYLSGQPAWYISTHLVLWKEGHRGGTKAADLMDDIAIHLTDQQIEAVSLWYAQQPAGR
ncbi:c-type cytochrome [Aureimonas psammosilenae]|uniref:c-type cytochrome n=1 Tax=Aureimonas psammosilenae TaxID=2495496 RepID=UPI001260B4EC|nr:c-type cytochrome [Aureimonas psammosilenae]